MAKSRSTKTSGAGGFRFDRMEVAGSLGDLGTLLPLMVGLITVNGLDPSITLISIGIFYAAVGGYYRLPIPVQPFKVFAAVAIAQGLSVGVLSAGALWMAAILLILAATNLITPLQKIFSKPVIRGIQLGLGMGLLIKGGKFLLDDALFLGAKSAAAQGAVSVNTLIGVIAFILALIFINNKKVPAAIILVFGGFAVGGFFGGFSVSELQIGFKTPSIALPAAEYFLPGLIVLALPQLPLTIGNAVMGTCETSNKLLGKEASKPVTPRALCVSMGLGNLLFGFTGGMPCCHGAGGLAAHYRFGARTGGSNIIIGAVFLALGLLFGRSALPVLTAIPQSVLGVLLGFAGIELSMMVVDLKKKSELFVTIVIAGTALFTGNMGIAFATGIIVEQIMKQLKIEF